MTSSTDESPAAETIPDPQESDAADSDKGSANAEAAKYRKQLRAAEAERDALAQRVNAMQTREVERLAAEHLEQSDDLLTLARSSLPHSLVRMVTWIARQ